MARPLRLKIPGAAYHVMSRGIRKECIFFDDADRFRFLQILTALVTEFGVEVLGDCQMGNHSHLLVMTPNENLSEFMQQLDGQYGQYLNKRYHRVGHVFQGPFKCVLVENDIHLLIAINYVLMNPVAAGLVSGLEDWKWCTYRATAGLAPVPQYLSLTWLDVLFAGESRQQSQRRFREFMENSAPVEWHLAQDAPALGSEGFQRAVRSFIGQQWSRADVPRSYRALARPSLDFLLKADLGNHERALAIQRACVVYGYKQSEIAAALAMHPASISRIVCALRKSGRG